MNVVRPDPKTTYADADGFMPGDRVPGPAIVAVLTPGDHVLLTGLDDASAMGVYRLNDDGTFSRPVVEQGGKTVTP